MAFRETIEAVLKVKDANRFKAGLDKGARAVRKLGRDEEETAAQTKLLQEILQRLERQSVGVQAAMMSMAHSVDELGDEMVQTAAKAQLMNQVTKKSGSNAVFLGKSWAFWKDRLSLTRSELMTTALTISAYFSPAIIALGSSFAYAAIGGGAVAAAGMSTFLLGLLGLATVIKPVTENLKKITKAQDMYNLTVQQYGANSLQASRQAAHLYGVVQTQGGAPMLKAAQNLAKFKKEWASSTSPARGSILSIISGGIGGLRNLGPQLSSGVNQMAAALQQGLGGLFKTLQGGEMRATFNVMAETFDQAIGPGIKGATNVLVVFGRIIRASAPWVIRWAKAWQRTTQNWRSSTKDQSKLTRFLDGAVTHFKAWWGLAKSVGRVLKTLFNLSKDEGLGFVYTLTTIVDKFDAWLNKMNDTGKVAAFWTFWKQSVADAFDFLAHPDTWIPKFIAGVDRWLPVLMNHIATGIVNTAPVVASTFAKAFLNAGAWARFFTVGYFLKKFGFFKLLGGQAATIFLAPFAKQFAKGFAATIGLDLAAEGTLAKAMGKYGTATGKIFGKAFAGGVILGIALYGPDFAKKVSDKVADLLGQKRADPSALPGSPQAGGPNILDWLAGQLPDLNPLHLFSDPSTGPNATRNKKHPFARGGPVPGGAGGGVIPPGGFSLVGESGPELAGAGSRGTSIVPLSGNARHTLGPVDIPNLQNAMHITVYSQVKVDKREIGRAVSEQEAYDASRRGGLRRQR